MTLKDCTKEELIFIIKRLQFYSLSGDSYYVDRALLDVEEERESKKLAEAQRLSEYSAQKRQGIALEDFPARLRRLMEHECKSRKVLSDLCGLPHDAIRKYERGEVKPNMDALISLADYFEVSLDYLTCRTNFR